MAPSLGKVLVTGASGYIGMSVVELLLQKNYNIRVSVRNQQRADQLISKFPQHKSKIEFVFADISQPGAFDALLKDIVGVFHLASPLPNPSKNSVRKDYIDPAVQGTLSVLEASLKAPSVKRVIITSSYAAVANPSGDNSDHVITEKDWNPVTAEYAEAANNYFLAYLASKKLAEKAAWDFVAEHKPHFTVTTILPSYVLGPTLQNIESAADISSTFSLLYLHLSGGMKQPMPSDHNNHSVDVRDVAQAHVLAYENPKTANQRYILSSDTFEWQEIPAFARKHFPNQTPHATTETVPPAAFFAKVDNSKSINELGVKYHSKEETLKDTIQQIIDLSKKGKLQL